VDRTVGLDGARSKIAMMRTPDGHSKLELTKYHTPAAVRAEPENPPPYTLGLHRVMFGVDDNEPSSAPDETDLRVRECVMPYTVDFNTVSTVGLESLHSRSATSVWVRCSTCCTSSSMRGTQAPREPVCSGPISPRRPSA
jgi:hypothetical protein